MESKNWIAEEKLLSPHKDPNEPVVVLESKNWIVEEKLLGPHKDPNETVLGLLLFLYIYSSQNS